MSDEGRVPPHDLDAEAAVLSACMLDRDAFDELEGRLKPEHFYAEAHRQTFAAMVHQAAAGKPLDVVHVGGRLKDVGRIDQVGGMSYLIEILNAAPSVANVAKYADIVREKWRARECIKVGHQLTAEGYNNTESAKLIEHADGALFELGQGEGESAGLVHFLPIAKVVAKRVLDQINNPNGTPGTATGFARLDRMTGGLHDGDLTIIAARPGMGKTSFVLNVATNVAAGDDKAKAPGLEAIVFSLEMPQDQLAHRMACSEARVDVSSARTGHMNHHAWTRYSGAMAHLAKLPIWIDDTPGLTVATLRARVRRRIVLAEREKREVGVVVVDYLQLMKGRDGAHSREQEISEISRGLKGIAKELRVPVIALSQLNRSVESRKENRRPQISDLRESGAIEQDADNIIFIYRDDYYDRESAERGLAELIVAKQRNGPTGMVKVRFDKEFTRFDNIADGEHWDDEEAAQ